MSDLRSRTSGLLFRDLANPFWFGWSLLRWRRQRFINWWLGWLWHGRFVHFSYRRLRDNGRGRNDRFNWRWHCTARHETVQSGKIFSNDCIIIENQRKNTNNHREDVARQHACDFKNSDIRGWLHGLSRMAEKLRRINKFEDSKNSWQDCKG